MTGALPYLRALRKSDLVVMAEKSDLKDYEDYKKPELEAALDEHLSLNSSVLSKEPSLSEYYERLSRPPRTSPVKKEPKSEPSLDEAISPSKRVTRSKRTGKTKQESGVSDESDSASAAGSASAADVAQTPVRQTMGFSLPPSPAVVTEAIEEQTTKVCQSLSEMWAASGLKEQTHALRSWLSSVSTIEGLILAIELYGLNREIVPSRYLATIPETSFTSPFHVRIPDVFILLTAAFWAPFSLWLMTSVVLPGILAYFFNINLKITQPVKVHSYGTRRASALQATTAARNIHSDFDPLVFNVSKALVSYLVYGNRFTFWEMYNPISLDRVVRSIPGGLTGLLTGSAICTLGSLYEAVLRR